MKLWTCVAKLFSTTAYTGCVQWAFNFNYDLPLNKLRILKITFLCVLQVNDARLDPTMVSRIDSKVVNRHWSWTVSPRVTRSWSLHLHNHVPKLMLPAATTDLLLLPLAISMSCYCWPSQQPAAGLAMASCASCLVIGLARTRFRLPLWLRWAPRAPFSLFYLLCPSSRGVSVLRLLYGVVCNRSNLLDVILLL
jgi:hypothetical protein